MGCAEDLERIERARRDNVVWEAIGPDTRRGVSFDVGHDHSNFGDCPGGGHGIAGMKVRFLLQGPAGVVQWVAYMNNWIPGNVDWLGTVRAEWSLSLVPVRHEDLGDGMAFDLGYHRPTPPDWDEDGSTRMETCHLLPEGYCYYDGSSLNAQPVLEAFLEHGPHAVWAALARYYQEALG